jgi:hypothetical protein
MGTTKVDDLLTTLKNNRILAFIIVFGLSISSIVAFWDNISQLKNNISLLSDDGTPSGRNSKVVDLYPNILADFGLQTNLSYIKDRFGEPNHRYESTFYIYEPDTISRTCYEYIFSRGYICFYFSKGSETVESVKLYSNNPKYLYYIPGLTEFLEKNHFKETKLGELSLGQMDEFITPFDGYEEGVINDESSIFSIYLGKLLNYQQFLIGFDEFPLPEKIENDKIENLPKEYKDKKFDLISM